MTNLTFLNQDGFKLTKTLDLGRFNEALSGQTLNVWLNLDRQWYADLVAMRVKGDENRDWLATEQERIDALPEDEQKAAYAAFAAEINARANELNAKAFDVWARLWGCTPDEAKAILDVSEPLYSWCIEAALGEVEAYRAGRKNS